MIEQLVVPIVQAPMAGGPSTPQLTAAVSNAGGLGFIAAGYRATHDLRADMASVRELTDRPFGVNLFAPTGRPADPLDVRRYTTVTGFMLCQEAGTSDAHRKALALTRPTGLTRAFTGRLARGITNRLQSDHTGHAPLAYPEVRYLTAPLRAHARHAGDEDLINLSAGQAHRLARPAPAAEVVAEPMADATAAAASLTQRLARLSG